MKIVYIFLIFLFSLSTYAQKIKIQGKIISAENSEYLSGAKVSIPTLKTGAIADKYGDYQIKDIPEGEYLLSISYPGYVTLDTTVELSKQSIFTINFELKFSVIESKTIMVTASRAVERETPVAFTDISKADMDLKLGGQDLPMLLNETPGVYATGTGGGFGDSRVNIRGFDQSNIAVMINGVPVNDMESGWVYWSNWGGLADVTSSMQVQRGLGAARIANPSVGGSINILTDPTLKKPSIKVKQERGADQYYKTTVSTNTGILDKFGANAAFTYINAAGQVEKTWTTGLSYYLGMKYIPSENHQFEFYLIGAKQDHGQRSFQQSIITFDRQTAIDQGITDPSYLAKPSYGVLYNPHWGNISPDYYSLQFYNKGYHERPYPDFLNERTNYFQKPQMNLNWFWQINEKSSLSNVFFLSTGSGGGTLGLGSIMDSTGHYNFNAMYSANDTNVDYKYFKYGNKSTRIIENNVNNHFWMGYLGTYKKILTTNLVFQGGLDFRYYEGYHWTEIRDLLGGDFYLDFANQHENDSSQHVKKLGDMIYKHYNGYVRNIGGFAQIEYSDDYYSSYLIGSMTNTAYKRKDYFNLNPNGSNDPWSTDYKTFLGYTVKCGANYNINSDYNLFFNTGYYTKPPQFNNTFTSKNMLFKNPENESILGFELGSGYNVDGLKINLDGYYTFWHNRAVNYSSNTGDYSLPKNDAVHRGIELKGAYQIIKWMQCNFMLSLGDWKWASDGVVNMYDTQGQLDSSFKIYLNGVRVADAAQKSAALGLTMKPLKKSTINIIYKYFWDLYSAFAPLSRTMPNDHTQPWKLPNYGTLDLNGRYSIYMGSSFDLNLQFNIFNILNTKFMSDGTDNRQGVNFKIDKDKQPTDDNLMMFHDAQHAEVFFGQLRRWNLLLQIVY
ncbi:MAG: TonB-dependent receptor [Candidatus Kapabacteria bacterium]|nr:TonB-dependent receptor [Candidatus Kapabacteria bacterium]